MFLSYRDGLSFYGQNHKYPMRCVLVEGLTEESWEEAGGECPAQLCHRHPGWLERVGHHTSETQCLCL